MTAVQLAKARLVPQDGDPIVVQFNPVSLQYEVSNSLNQQNRDATRRQIVTQSNARLSVELQFDTTSSGTSVRELTLPIKRLLRPDEADTRDTADIVPPVVRFEWGTFLFSGLIESYRETLDFFSSEGVPLRAQVSLSMTHQTRASEPAPAAGLRRTPRSSTPAVLERCTPQGVDGAAGLGQRFGGGGGGSLARGIASANGEESLRHSSRSALAMPQTQSGAPSRGRSGLREAGTSSMDADVGQHTPLSERLRFDE
jgi:Contractile injection system tube protein